MTDSQLRAGLKIARDCACATACVEPYALPMWAEALAGFPHCNSHPDVIVAEGTRALSEGATEIDIVVNAGKGLGGDGDYGASELEQVNDAMTARDAIKVLFATKLTDVL